MLRVLPLAVIAGAILFLTAYGAGIYPWTVCVVLLAFAITALLVRAPSEADAPPLNRPRLTIPALYATLLVFLVLLLIPLPLAATRITGPHRFEQNRLVVDTLTSAKSLDVDVPRLILFSTVRNRAGALRALLLLATLFGGWSIARRFSASQRTTWVRLLIGIGTITAVLGHLSKWVFPQGDTLWWLIPVPHGLPGPVGGFINPNHFAGFVAMLAPLALATAVVDARNKHWFVVFVDMMAFALMTLAVLFSMSRGGVVAFAGGMAVLLVMFSLRSGHVGRLVLAGTLVLIVGSGVVLAIQNAQVRERLLSLRSPATTASLQERLGAWKDTAGMWRRYPLVGVGPNAFLMTYPQHRTSSSRAARDFAENEYVQIMGETGITGGVLFLLFLFVLLRQARRAMAKQSKAEFRCAPAAIGALAVAATHALVDFPLHLPLYAITAATLLGYLWPPTDSPETGGAARWPHFAAIAIAVLALSLGPAIRRDSSGLLSGAKAPQLTRALVWAPTFPLIWRRLGGELSKGKTLQHRHLAEHCLTQAADYDPNNYPLWRRLGEVRQDLGDNRGANQAYRRVEALRDWIQLPVLPEE